MNVKRTLRTRFVIVSLTIKRVDGFLNSLGIIKKKKTFMADRVYLTFNWKILSQAHILVLSENKEETSHSSVNTVSNAQAFSKLHAISTNQSRFHSSRSSKRIMLQAMLLFRDRKPVS